MILLYLIRNQNKKQMEILKTKFLYQQLEKYQNIQVFHNQLKNKSLFYNKKK